MRPLERILPGSKSVAQLMAVRDWSQTRLGPRENWPQSLQTAIALCLDSEGMLSIFWSKDLLFLYNDSWAPLIADRHPVALGSPAQDVFGENWRELQTCCCQVLETGKPASIKHQRLEGSAGLYLDHSFSPLRNAEGQVEGVFAMSSKSAAQLHRFDDAGYKALLAAAAAGICATNADGVFTHVNERYCELVGRRREELIGRMSFLDLTHPEDAERNRAVLGSATDGNRSFSIEKRYIRPDGSVLWANVYASWLGAQSDNSGRWIAVAVDISERKLAEEVMRESEERKSFLLQLGDRLRTLYDPVAVMDTAAEMLGRHLRVNRVTYGEILADGKVMSGRDYVDGVASLPRRFHLAESAPAVLEHFLQDRTSVDVDILKDASLTPEQQRDWQSVAVRAHVSVPLRKNGQLVAGLGVHQAVPRQWTESEILLIEETAERTWAAVEQARAEAALRFSEARLSAIFAQAAVGLSELGLDGRFKHVNDQLCKLLGRSREQLLELKSTDVTHPEDVAASQRGLERLVADGRPALLDERYLHPDGSIIHGSSALSRLDDDEGRPRAILAVTVDLTERKQAEAALRDSEERYRTLFSSIDEGFCVVEMHFDDSGKAFDYTFVEVNPAFARQTGIAEASGRRMREIAPEHEEHWFETYGRIALTGEPQRFINQARGLGGRWFDVYAFRFGKPESRRVAALFSDITHRMQAEEELRQADRRKNEFLAMLAHELRNPLAPIRTGLEVLRLSQGQRQTTERMIELMERQMQQMVRLVDDLLDISRITQGKVQIRPEFCELQVIMDSAIEGSRPLIGASGIKLNINAPTDRVELQADPARLAQVFSNLLNNAAKYTDPGGQVWFTAERRDGDLVVKVRDTGTGIPATMLEPIFEPFTQVGNSLGRSHGGLGVGLSLVQTLVELHGGTVRAYSEGPDKGSEFIVHLPGIVRDGEQRESPVEADSPLRQHRILVVDDNTDAANALAMMLGIMGNEVRVAHNGRDGIALADEFRPHLLLLDLGMPELDGYETARLIRARRWGKSMMIAALTGWGQEEDRRRSLEAGFDHHLVKPVERRSLHKLLRELAIKER